MLMMPPPLNIFADAAAMLPIFSIFSAAIAAAFFAVSIWRRRYTPCFVAFRGLPPFFRALLDTPFLPYAFRR